MSANTCRHCGADPCLPVWRKLTLGPAASTACRTCGLKVGVDVPKACLAMAPTFALVLLAATGLLRDPVALVVLLGLCLGGTCVLYWAWTPIMRDELSNARMVEAGKARVAARKHRGGRA